MSGHSSRAKGRRQLRWKLTLSYTLVTAGALLTVELLLLGALSVLLFVLVNSGALPAQLIEAASSSYTPELRFYLGQTPPDQEAIAGWLSRGGGAPSTTLPLSFDATDEMMVVGSDGRLLGARPADLLGSDQIGQPLDFQSVPGLAAPLQAALAGEEDADRLYTPTTADDKVILAMPIWDAEHEQVLGALAALAEAPTIGSVLGDLLPILGGSLLFFTLIAALAGTAYGFLAARGPVQRLDRLSEATLAWSQGDFSLSVDDPSDDELGLLAQRLNEMAHQLQQLLEARRSLAIEKERNRLARDLHDSVKQQAFAAAAQLSVVRTLIQSDPEEAAVHAEEAERLIYELRQELTGLIQELRPVALEGKGLASAIRDYAADWSRLNGVTLEVLVEGERPLPVNIEQTVFRIVQEALSNVARHSQAHRAEIGLIYGELDLVCTITDDGVGFDPKGTVNGFGIRSMEERAHLIGSSLTIEDVGGSGTRISFVVPLSTLPISEES